MIDVKALAQQAGYFLYDLTETHGIKTVESDETDQWVQLERYTALVLESAAVKCDDIWQEDGTALLCRDAIRALSPGCVVWCARKDSNPQPGA